MKKRSKKKVAKTQHKSDKKARKQKVSIAAVEQQVEKSPVILDTISELSNEELVPILEGYDEESLTRAKTHWYFGEWKALASLNLDTLQHHPDRDRFVLLVASAHQQLGNHDKARKYGRMALEWGCSPRVIAQILIAGVHNTLGRAAALKQDEPRIARHFEAAVDISNSRDTELFSYTRSMREMSRMGLQPQEHIREQRIDDSHSIDTQIDGGHCVFVDSGTYKKNKHPTNLQNQLVVLGMHRSGTSCVTNLMHLMGAYFGSSEESTGANPENPKGFWERRDMRNICDGLLYRHDFDWWQVSNFDVNNIQKSTVSQYLDKFSDLLEKMNKHPLWIIKEPRLCLLFPVLKDLLKNPIVIHVYRNPIEVAMSLKRRNKFPYAFGLSLWEKYNHAAFKASIGLPRILVSYNELMSNPIRTSEVIREELSSCFDVNLTLPTEQVINSLIDTSLHRNKAESFYLNDWLSGSQYDLYMAMKDGSIFDSLTSNSLSYSPVCIDTLRFYEEINS